MTTPIQSAKGIPAHAYSAHVEAVLSRRLNKPITLKNVVTLLSRVWIWFLYTTLIAWLVFIEYMALTNAPQHIPHR